MYGQSCRVVGHRELGPLRFSGGIPLLRAQPDLPQPPVREFYPGPLGPHGKAIHRLAKVLVAAVDREQRVQRPALPGAPDVGVVRLVLPGVPVGAGVVCWGVSSSGRRELVPCTTQWPVGAL